MHKLLGCDNNSSGFLHISLTYQQDLFNKGHKGHIYNDKRHLGVSEADFWLHVQYFINVQ